MRYYSICLYAWLFSLNIYTWKVKVKSLSRVRLFATLWTVAYQAPPSMGFSRQEYWSGLPLPSPGDLPKPGIEPGSPTLEADALTSEPPGKPNIYIHMYIFVYIVLVSNHVQIFCDPTDHSPAGSSVHGTSQVRKLEWAVISFSRRSSWPRSNLQLLRAQVGSLPFEPPGKHFFQWLYQFMFPPTMHANNSISAELYTTLIFLPDF